MQFTCRKATREDLPRLAEIEKKSVSGGYYLVGCYDEFMDPARGELVVGVDENGVPQGFGHVALLHDGSAWLECLRVDPAAQKMGCGAAMWVRFVSYCKEKGCSHLGMFTGAKNYPSKVLAERNGLHLDYTSREGSLLREDAPQVSLPQGWMLLRQSLHDPILPLNAEGNAPGDCRKLLDLAAELLAGCPGLDLSVLQ